MFAHLRYLQHTILQAFTLFSVCLAVGIMGACEQEINGLPAASAPETEQLRRGLIRPRVFRLPAGETKTLVALTYDDGHASQLDAAVPQLDARGLRGTFYLNAIRQEAAAARWRAVAATGHELGNHTLTHPCPRALPQPPGASTEEFTIQRYRANVLAQDSILDRIDGRVNAPRTLAYPCSRAYVGEDDASLLPMLDRLACVSAARTGNTTSGEIIKAGKAYSPFEVPSYILNLDTKYDEVVRRLEEARRAGGAIVITFHTVGGQFESISAADHARFLDYLVAHRDRFEVLTFAGLAERCTDRMPAEFEVLQESHKEWP